jgi:heme exporter protein C
MPVRDKPPAASGLGLGFILVAALVAVGFLLAPQMIVRAPIETTMGPVQKIFYFHVPCAWLLMLSVFVSAGGSIAFLFKGSERGDRIALSAAELAVLFGICVLVTGPLWAKVAWGVYWQWDARLTSSLLLWLIMVAYLLARRYGGPASRKLAAALALFAAADVPLVYVSVHIWRTIHPKTTVVKTLDPAMRPAFYVSLLVFTALWSILFILRSRLEHTRAAVAELALEVDDALEVRTS